MGSMEQMDFFDEPGEDDGETEDTEEEDMTQEEEEKKEGKPRKKETKESVMSSMGFKTFVSEEEKKKIGPGRAAWLKMIEEKRKEKK